MKSLERRIADLEQITAPAPDMPRIIVLAGPGERSDNLTDGRHTWQREAAESREAFLARVRSTLGEGPPVLMWAPKNQ